MFLIFPHVVIYTCGPGGPGGPSLPLKPGGPGIPSLPLNPGTPSVPFIPGIPTSPGSPLVPYICTFNTASILEKYYILVIQEVLMVLQFHLCLASPFHQAFKQDPNTDTTVTAYDSTTKSTCIPGGPGRPIDPLTPISPFGPTGPGGPYNINTYTTETT